MHLCNTKILPFIVSTDASDKAVGGVLSQIQGGHEPVIADWSRQLQMAECIYSTIEREALAVVGNQGILPIFIWLFFQMNHRPQPPYFS